MIASLDALLESVRSGIGALVVVEGQTRLDDPRYYGKWFGAIAREISFVHQDGHALVKKAVAYLREHAPRHPVFGLIDRDFTSRDETDATDPLETGLYRTGWYTLENYFFADIDAWMQILRTLTDDEPPAGWSTPEEVQARIHDAYRISLPVAAWNSVIHQEYRRTGFYEGSPGFHKHHNAINDETLATLTQWGETRAAPIRLRDLYRARLEELTVASPEVWPEHVSGKVVFQRFIEKFPKLHPHDKLAVLRRLYFSQQPAPPPDLAAIVDEIRREAAKLRRPGT